MNTDSEAECYNEFKTKGAEEVPKTKYNSQEAWLKLKEISENIESKKEHKLHDHDIKSVKDHENEEIAEHTYDPDLEMSSEFSFTSGYRSSNSEILSEHSGEDNLNEEDVVGEVLETTIDTAVEKVEQRLHKSSAEQG